MLDDSPARVMERRLSLWRKAIALFDKTNQWEGVFHIAGYREWVLEPEMDNKTTPDIVGASDLRFVLCELSASPNKDFLWFDGYERARLTPFLEGLLGVARPEPGAAPFFITTEAGFRDIPARVNALLVRAPWDRRCPSVADPTLQGALDAWQGFAGPPPSYSFLALPESETQEVKLPLAGILRLRASTGGSLSSKEATELLLGDIADHVPAKGKRKLEETVHKLLGQAAQFLKDFARYDNKRRVLRLAEVDSASGKKKFSKAVSEWSGARFIDAWVEPVDDVADLDDDL